MKLIFGQIVKVKSQKVWSRSVNFCGDGEGKTWRGGIGLMTASCCLRSLVYEVQSAE